MVRDYYANVTSRVLELSDSDYIHYHPECRKAFTVVKRRADSPIDNVSKRPRRGEDVLYSKRKGNILGAACIFCNKSKKMVFGKTEGLSVCNTKQGCDAFKASIRCSADVKLNSLLNEGEDLIAREAKYHKICRRFFFSKVLK